MQHRPRKPLISNDFLTAGVCLLSRVSGVRIPAGAPKNLLAFWRGDFFWSLPGSRSLSPIGEIPAGAPKRISRLSAGDSFFGRARGVEVYPQQGKSPLEHQKESLAFRRGILFSVAPGESKFIPSRGNPRWSTKNLQASQYACRFLLFRSSLFTIHFTVKCAGAWPLFISPLRVIAAIRLRGHIIIIYNDIHARVEPAGILQKIRV